MSNPYEQQNQPTWGGQPQDQQGQGQPTSQPSASYPPGTGADGYPMSQPSASYPPAPQGYGSQPTASYPADASYPAEAGGQGAATGAQPGTQQGTGQGIPQPAAAWGAAGDPWAQSAPQQQGMAYGGGPGGGQPTPGGATADRRRKEGGFGALFDLSFRKYATPTLAKVIYTLVLVTAGLSWLGTTLLLFIMAGLVSTASGDAAAPITLFGVVWLLVGWIPSLLQLIYSRAFLELVISGIRTAEDVDALRTKLAD